MAHFKSRRPSGRHSSYIRNPQKKPGNPPDGTFSVNRARIKEGVKALTQEIMTIQAHGDYASAKALAERLGVVRPAVERALRKLAGVPVDIEPRFTTAEQLLAGSPARGHQR